MKMDVKSGEKSNYLARNIQNTDEKNSKWEKLTVPPVAYLLLL
jgi:hypothetical protein